ncbi:MAG: class I SAM-dependent methyltransferase [Thermoleophilia bacterium]
MTEGRRAPAWAGLVAHSYRIAGGWAARGLRRRSAGASGPRWPHPRAGLYRALVPLEPWRYYELARVAAEPFSGDCLDLSSPKLLASMLNRRRRGRWVAVDLLASEVEIWRALDPDLDLRVEDARALSFADGSFDAVACVSVIEHVEGDGDATAMAEMWRVLRPGGVLHLTTNVAAAAGEVRTAAAVYGAADAPVGPEGAFFERRYDDAALSSRLLALPWIEEAREYRRQRRPVHERFFAARPLSFLAGPLLPLVCVRNFAPIPSAAAVPEGEHAVVYLRLRRPA